VITRSRLGRVCCSIGGANGGCELGARLTSESNGSENLNRNNKRLQLVARDAALRQTRLKILNEPGSFNDVELGSAEWLRPVQRDDGPSALYFPEMESTAL
jgi:hypothetical protein